MANVSQCKKVPNAYSSSAEWITWYDALKKCVGKKNAKMLWSLAWQKYGRQGTDASSSTLRKKMEKEGIEIDKTMGESLEDFGYDVGNWFGNGFKFMGVLGYILAGGVVLGILAIIYNIAKDPYRAGRAVGTRGVSELGGGMGKPRIK